ncbi:MAG: hypothetical protein JO148_05680 [Acidimicrobiia bacterium]|nr:hypothetical protein [Acidimicrobiia bacterium]
MANDRALEALLALRSALGTTEEWLGRAVERSNQIEHYREQGYTWQQVLTTEDRPLMSEIVNRHIALLAEVTDRFRREEARCLSDEGVKPGEIADIFGVTVTHVEAMLANPSAPQ